MAVHIGSVPAVNGSARRAAAAGREHAAPAPVPYPPPAGAFRAGTGQVHAHHGEVVQAMFYSAGPA
ncbi:MAG TPA: hypothetical protein VFJ82_06135, partial [Longimicrobium sp.]|nr:hypothetical protein [Longimicrobium sp.]